jgi:hypothetical protein
MNSNIVEAQEMMECIWPELGSKIGTSQHGTNGITDCLMWALPRAILMRGAGCSGFNGITSTLKETDNLW